MAQDQQTPEQKLKLSLAICIADLEITRRYPSADQIHEHFFQFIKSGAVKEYWQREHPKTDSDYIRNMILDLANDNNWQLSVDKLMSYLEKHLQPARKTRPLTVAFMRDLESKLSKDEISYSRMVEIINELFDRPDPPINKAYAVSAGGFLYEDLSPAPDQDADDQDTIRTSKPLF